MVTIGSEYLDGVWVILIGRFCLQGAFELAKIVVNILTIGHACNIELDDFELIVILGPYGDVVAIIYETEMFKHLYFRIIVTATYDNLGR